MSEKEKQMFCQLLELSAEQVEGLDLVARKGGYDNVRHMVQHVLVMQLYAIPSFDPRYTSRALREVLAEAAGHGRGSFSVEVNSTNRPSVPNKKGGLQCIPALEVVKCLAGKNRERTSMICISIAPELRRLALAYMLNAVRQCARLTLGTVLANL